MRTFIKVNTDEEGSIVMEKEYGKRNYCSNNLARDYPYIEIKKRFDSCHLRTKGGVLGDGGLIIEFKDYISNNITSPEIY